MTPVLSEPISLQATTPHGVSLPPAWFTPLEQHRAFQDLISRALQNPPEWFTRRAMSVCDTPTLLTGLPAQFQACVTLSVPWAAFIPDNIHHEGNDPLAHETVGAFVRSRSKLFIPGDGWSSAGRLLVPSPLQANHLLASLPVTLVGSYGEPSLREMLLHLMQGNRPVALFYPGASNNLSRVHGAHDLDPVCAYFHDLFHASNFCQFTRDDVRMIATRLYATYDNLLRKRDPYLPYLERLVLEFCDGWATSKLLKPSRSERAWRLFLSEELNRD